MTKKYIRANQDIDTSLLSLEMMWRGINDIRIKDQIGITAPDSYLEVIEGNTINYCVEETKAKIFFENCAYSLINNEQLLKSLKEKTITLTNEMQKYAREMLPIVKEIEGKEISKALEKIRFYQAECGLHGAVIAFADVCGIISNKLIEIVMKRSNLEYPVHVYTSILGSPYEKSLTEKAYIDIQNNDESTDSLLKEYFWLNQGYIGRGLKEDELEKIKNNKLSESKITSPRLEKELKLSSEETKLFKISKDIIFTKSLRADVRQFLYVIMNNLVDNLAEKWGVESKYVENLYANELIDINNGKFSLPEKTDERYQHSIILPLNSQNYEIKIGVDAEEFVNIHFFEEETNAVEDLKGQVAFPGKVQGMVRLVFGPQHNTKVSDGDILVSSATSPQLLPAMKRAGAFITDFGGITSHAAIVARELKIPCIVGTKVATQILQDGDMVEVDADNGVVTKLVV